VSFKRHFNQRFIIFFFLFLLVASITLVFFFFSLLFVLNLNSLQSRGTEKEEKKNENIYMTLKIRSREKKKESTSGHISDSSQFLSLGSNFTHCASTQFLPHLKTSRPGIIFFKKKNIESNRLLLGHQERESCFAFLLPIKLFQ
jgi:flagellar biosynthesis component FlhA